MTLTDNSSATSLNTQEVDEKFDRFLYEDCILEPLAAHAWAQCAPSTVARNSIGSGRLGQWWRPQGVQVCVGYRLRQGRGVYDRVSE